MKDRIWLDEMIQHLLITLGKTVRQWREERGLSQEEFADLAGIARPTVSSLELAMREPRIGTVIRVLWVMKPPYFTQAMDTWCGLRGASSLLR